MGWSYYSNCWVIVLKRERFSLNMSNNNGWMNKKMTSLPELKIDFPCDTVRHG